MDRKDVFEYVKKQYGTVPEYLWKESPESAVLRHKNGKWYAVLMQVKKSKLELEGEGTVDIINVKCEPDMVGVLIETYTQDISDEPAEPTEEIDSYEMESEDDSTESEGEESEISGEADE